MKKEVKLLRAIAIESLILSIELFNRPSDARRSHSVLIFLDHAFEMLFKAAILHRAVGFASNAPFLEITHQWQLILDDAGAINSSRRPLAKPNMSPRRITAIYFWSCAFLIPLGMLMFLLGLFGLYWFISSEGTLRSAWGSRPATLPFWITTIAFIALPLWGMRTWWIHRYSLKGDEKRASSRWLETGLLNIASMLFWLFLWSQDFDHQTYFPAFATAIGTNLFVALLAFWMETRTRI
jgi:hypothetical protein